jgi:Flp pilus assembly protein TadG
VTVRPRVRPGSDRGQATVELALATPILCLLLLGVVQVAVVVRDQLLASEAARVGARAAAVSADTTSAGHGAAQRVLQGVGDASVAVVGDAVTVHVSIVNDTDIPLIGALLPDVTIDASATMLLEPP